jgi:hypothetical protein
MAEVKEFMAEEGYFDDDDEEFDWINAVNYCIADTTLCDEEYAEFVSESVNLDLLEVTSN